MTKISKSYLTTDQAAELLGLTESRVRRLIKKPFDRRTRVLHGEKIGRSRSWFVTINEVERFKKLPNPGAGRPSYSRKRKKRKKQKQAA